MTDKVKQQAVPAFPNENCEGCPVHSAANLLKLGVDMEDWDFAVALAGNPNTGKSTIFNALTGLRQHTGNWPGKTVTRAEGGFEYDNHRFKLVDLPGTYSLLATSKDEVVARDFILFGQPDVTLVVADANRLERNLNLVLQVLEITDRVVIALNLMDEAKRAGKIVDDRVLARDLGVPVIPTVARSMQGIPELLEAVNDVAIGKSRSKRYHIKNEPTELKSATRKLVKELKKTYPDLPNHRWLALRLLDGDERIIEAVRNNEFEKLGEQLAMSMPAESAA